MTDRPIDRPTDPADRPIDRPTVGAHPAIGGAVGSDPADRPTDSRPLRQRLARLVAGRGYRVVPTGPTYRTGPPAEPVGLRVALPTVVWGLSAITTFLAATGQIGFALWAGVTDWRRFLVPAGLELVAGAFMLLGYRRARRGHSPALMWLAAAAVGGFAIYTNVVHTGPRAGLLFGAASAITLLLWFAKLYDDYRDYRRQIDEDGLGLLWLLNPRLAFRALLMGKRLRIAKVSLTVMYAEVWIAVYDDAKAARVKGLRLRRRTAWRSVMKAAGHPVADLPTFATVDRVTVVDRPAQPMAAPAGPTGADRPAGSAPTEPTDTDPPADRVDARASRPRRSTGPTGRKSVSHIRLVHTPAAIANAALLRERYGDRLPDTVGQVRTAMRWSFDRADPAVSAYRAGADLEEGVA